MNTDTLKETIKSTSLYVLGRGKISVQTGTALDDTKTVISPFIQLNEFENIQTIGTVTSEPKFVPDTTTVIVITNLESLDVVQRSLDHCRKILTGNRTNKTK